MNAPRSLAPVALALSLLASPLTAMAQARCDCAASTCLPTAGDGVELRGRVEMREGRDASDALERYPALVVERPACAEFTSAESDSARQTVTADALQLVTHGAAEYGALRLLEGREVTLRGVAIEAFTAHHHTPLLLDVRAIVAPTASPAREVTGRRASSLAAALRRARGAARGGDASLYVGSFSCVEQGVGAGYDPTESGPPPPPRYACEGALDARGPLARTLWRAMIAAGVERDCAMGGRCALSTRGVFCRATSCTVGGEAEAITPLNRSSRGRGG